MYFIIGSEKILVKQAAPRSRFNIFSSLEPAILVSHTSSELARYLPEQGFYKVFLELKDAQLYVALCRNYTSDEGALETRGYSEFPIFCVEAQPIIDTKALRTSFRSEPIVDEPFPPNITEEQKATLDKTFDFRTFKRPGYYKIPCDELIVEKISVLLGDSEYEALEPLEHSSRASGSQSIESRL